MRSPTRAAPLDASLIHRVALRDDAALASLYEQYAGTVYSAALAILQSPADAEEILQETFLHIWTHARDYTSARGTLRVWVVMIARSRALDRLRTRAQQTRLAESTQHDTQVLAEPPETPLELTQQARLRGHISRELAELPSEQRRALELAFHEGLSHSEISQRTGDPLGTVKTRIRRGLERLARVFQSTDRE